MKPRYLIIIIVLVATLWAAKKKDGEQKMTQKANPVAVFEISNGADINGVIEVELLENLAPKTVANFVGLATGTKEWQDPKSGSMVKKPYYDSLIFHRVINDFMIQGGCPLGTGTGGPGYQFEDECFEKGAEMSGEIKSEEEAIMIFENIILPNLRSDKKDADLMKIYEECASQNSGKPIMKNSVEFYKEKTGFTGKVFAKGKLTAEIDYGTLCMANAGPNTNGSQFFIVTKKDGCNWLNGKHTVFGRVTKGMELAETIQNTPKGANDRPTKDVIITKLTIK